MMLLVLALSAFVSASAYQATRQCESHADCDPGQECIRHLFHTWCKDIPVPTPPPQAGWGDCPPACGPGRAEVAHRDVYGLAAPRNAYFLPERLEARRSQALRFPMRQNTYPIRQEYDEFGESHPMRKPEDSLEDCQANCQNIPYDPSWNLQLDDCMNGCAHHFGRRGIFY